MKYGIQRYQPATSWVTVALLIVVMIGFGVIADVHVQSDAAPASVTTAIAGMYQ